MHRFIVNIPDDVFKELKTIAFKKDISISKLLVGYILKQFELEKNLEQIETEKGE